MLKTNELMNTRRMALSPVQNEDAKKLLAQIATWNTRLLNEEDITELLIKELG